MRLYNEDRKGGEKMILPINRNEIIKCKKCGKTIKDTENAKLDKSGYNPYVIGEFPTVPFLLWQMREMKKQKRYNEKYGTENIYYRFGICKDCLEKRNRLKAILKLSMLVVKL